MRSSRWARSTNRARRLAEAAHAYKRLLMAAADDERRAQAIWRLAHVYEARQALRRRPATATSSCRRGFPTIMLEEPGGEATVAELVAAELARPPLRPARSPIVRVPRLRSRSFRRWHWQAPDRPADPSVIAVRGRPVAGCRPDLPGREDRPAAARPVDRLAALVGRAGRAGRLGRLPRRQADRGDPAPDRRARARAGDRAVAVRPGSRRARTRTGPTRSPMPRTASRRRGATARPRPCRRFSW